MAALRKTWNLSVLLDIDINARDEDLVLSLGLSASSTKLKQDPINAAVADNAKLLFPGA
jgi:hypothetical protein